MSPHAPPHLAKIAPVLLAGEDVRWMGKPNIGWLALLEVMAGLSAFVGFFLIVWISSGLPPGLSAGISVVAALAAIAILHFLIGMRTYVITDQRLLIITSFSNDVHDSCELSEIESITPMKFGSTLKIKRRNSEKLMTLWALGDRDGVAEALSSRQ